MEPRLDEQGRVAEPANLTGSDAQWWQRFVKLEEVKAQQGTCHLTPRNCSDTQLLKWVNNQKVQWRKHDRGSLSGWRMKQLERIRAPSDWTGYSKAGQWRANFAKLEGYATQFGDCNVECDYADPTLTKWVETQRWNYKKQNHGNLVPWRLAELKRISAIEDWKVAEGTDEAMWQANFQLLKAYHEEHGTFDVPRTYRGPTQSNRLGAWVAWQKRIRHRPGHGTLTPERYAQLEELGVIAVWQQMETGVKEDDEGTQQGARALRHLSG
ncbi:hypothetical protein AB1Y20_005297 [Prymnesium parvum]|uniref:Helicase-associated domain-containing protein n=1 Tax=Prymnesium parvum TaxID=97485 RepID=A0AB34J3W2_PRYPA